MRPPRKRRVWDIIIDTGSLLTGGQPGGTMGLVQGAMILVLAVLIVSILMVLSSR